MPDRRKFFTWSEKSTSTRTSSVRSSTRSEQSFTYSITSAGNHPIPMRSSFRDATCFGGPVRSNMLLPAFSPTGNAARSTSSGISLTNNNTPNSYCLNTGKAYVYIFNFNKFKNSNTPVRKGSEHDVKLLENFFSKYRVKVLKVYKDLPLVQVKKKMTKVSKKKFDDCSCVIFVMMSHGDIREQIHSFDKIFNMEEDVVEKVLMNETLKGIPKLFFVQACKGNARMESDFQPSATNKNDIYKCYSTYEGTLCWRDEDKGSAFIQNLFPLIETNGDKDIAEVMTLLRKKFSNHGIQQAPTDTTTLTKKFYFNELKL